MAAPAHTSRSDSIRFVLGGEVREIDTIDPNTTVLNYLREEEHRTGTKEGCAEGDCGACTVVLGEIAGRKIRYRAVNACLMFVPVLDGKQLITIEDLKAGDGNLHPTQQAMVDCHGSQCGFCTPGIVMSLFALYKSGATPTRPVVDDTLAGNLCRCTGYRPIADAAARMKASGTEDGGDAAQRHARKLLRSLQRTGTFTYGAQGKRYFAPRTLAGLARLLRKHPKAVLLAGGTDIGLLVTKQHRDLETVIYTGEVKELGMLRVASGHLEIGAAVTYSDCMDAIARQYPAFGELIRRLGSVQIRNLGTVGGNVANASPIGDSLPALMSLGATVVLRKSGAVREIPLERFFVDYRKTALTKGEFVARLRLPVASPGRRFAVYKIAKRFDQDISAVCAAFNLVLDGDRVADIRIACGGMAAVPKRATACERALRGKRWSTASVEAAAAAMDEDFQPLSDMRASDAYRRLVARNLLRKFWMETTGQGGDMNVALYGRPA